MVKKKHWKCPRCGKRLLIQEDRCSYCGLIRSRLQNVSNAAGKKALKNKEYNKVIYYNKLPKDVSKWKLLLYSIFLGWCGVQFAVVGRKKPFIYMLISAILLNIFTILLVSEIFPIEYMEHPYWGVLGWGMVFPASCGLFVWGGSIFQIIFGFFKVPVSIEESYLVEGVDSEVAKDIIEQVKIDREISKKEEQSLNKKSNKNKKIRVICASCGMFVKVDEDETICPKCGESLKG